MEYNSPNEHYSYTPKKMTNFFIRTSQKTQVMKYKYI